MAQDHFKDDEHGEGAASASTAPKARRVDPLVLLRDCNIAGKKARYADDYLELDGYRIHRTTKCGFRLAPSEPFMDIGSVWYMFHEVSGDRPYSIETTRKRGFQYIGVTSRGDLCDYLVGKLPTCPGIVQDVIEGRKRPREETLGVTPAAPRAKTPKVLSAEAEAAARLKKAQELTYEDVLARVRPVKELDVLVRAPGRIVPNADLILKIARDEVLNWNRPASKADQILGGKVPLIQEIEEMLAENSKNLPIILVPCNKNAPVNLLNAQSLLQDGQYFKLDEEKVQFFESTRTERVEVVRNIRGKQWTFEVRDSTKGFTKSQWLRVVAVVTDGFDWQFTGWPFETIVDLFATVRGIYFKAVGAPLPTHVNEWAVAILLMAPLEFQHRFAAVRDNFWTEVETFLTSSRSKKFVNHTTLEGKRKTVKMMKPVL